ncbi:NAD-dependent epimerase/dehydratase family protein [Micromonospora eburnea]|uniref:Nucleoside-diphosphate-sugar epimerase n=1 Tax=Micromonospora eburnea TaxID=227316 RepID=A0A1C6VBP9_9ACTN|nr:NAD(P)-dependent oxidoreductase [Micromonospora eburnea]SCL63811.1 Nucleoside-diphosphate-sugar epimerase [Micromonospora eburnea]
MRVLVAGASGVIGVPLTRRLREHGHEVYGLTRDPGRARTLADRGVRAVVADAMDRDGLLRAVDGLAADVVIHELTALTRTPTRHSGVTQTNRLRTEGTANLLAAAEVIGAGRFLTQSIVLGYGYRDHGDRVRTEADPFGEPQGTKVDPHLSAIRATEQQAFTAPHGIALRYGMFYGGDTARLRPMLMKRRVPVANGGVLPWVHVEDAAAATVAALEQGRAGQAYNIADDEPATLAQVFTALARAFGAPAPRRLPAWLLRLAAPYAAAFAIDTNLRVSTRKAHAELGWRPAYPSYREGVATLTHG